MKTFLDNIFVLVVFSVIGLVLEIFSFGLFTAMGIERSLSVGDAWLVGFGAFLYHMTTPGLGWPRRD